MTESLGTALPKEMARIRDKLLPLYDAIPSGVFAATMMRADLDRAARAMAEGDTVEMIKAYESLKGYKEAIAKCCALGLHPLNDPMGDDHHTDAPFSDEDERLGDAISYFLGGIFVDTSAAYFYREMTSIDIWRRVARALRVHGLRIADRDDDLDAPR